MDDKMIDLCLWYQIEDSNTCLKIMEDQAKILEERQKMMLNKLDKCLFDFQKRKINNELGQIENEMFNQYEKIGEKVDMINKLKSAITNNDF